jgi:hypothetical protein
MGLASAVGAALVSHCLEHGLDADWDTDATNLPSQRLARKLGYMPESTYEWLILQGAGDAASAASGGVRPEGRATMPFVLRIRLDLHALMLKRHAQPGGLYQENLCQLTITIKRLQHAT